MERLAWRLTGEVLPYWRSVLVIFVVNLLAVPLALLTPVPLKIAVDNVLGDKPLPRYLDVLLPERWRARTSGSCWQQRCCRCSSSCWPSCSR
jgi:hypothetical protein